MMDDEVDTAAMADAANSSTSSTCCRSLNSTFAGVILLRFRADSKGLMLVGALVGLVHA